MHDFVLFTTHTVSTYKNINNEILLHINKQYATLGRHTIHMPLIEVRLSLGGKLSEYFIMNGVQAYSISAWDLPTFVYSLAT